MILLIDIGNTSVALALYSKGKVRRIKYTSGIQQHKKEQLEAIRTCINQNQITGVMIASVVPACKAGWERNVQELTGKKPIFLTHKTKLPIPIHFPRPETIGADRLANASAAAVRYGTPVLVLDAGTALTFDVVVKEKGYIGGVIAPGYSLMFRYLAEKTALLPLIKPDKLNRSIGKSTEEAMRIGAQLGYRGLIRELIREIKKELGVRKLNICATGGYAQLALEGLDMRISVDDDLTLFGLGIIYELNDASHKTKI